MVVRREADGFRTYCHFGTGNYHPITARIYTDLSFFTANPKIGRDAAQLFNYITGYVTPVELNSLLISPLCLLEKLCALIDRYIAFAAAFLPASFCSMLYVRYISLLNSFLYFPSLFPSSPLLFFFFFFFFFF